MTKSTRVIRRTLTPMWQQALDFELNDNTLRAIKRMSFVAYFFLEVMDWDSIFAHDFIGQHKVKIEINQENIQQKWLPLYDKDYNSEHKKGEILATIEVENIWAGVKDVKLDDVGTNNAGNQAAQKKKKGFFGL
ncbi:hypothetical protein RFI_12643 [Reticulomyxa filosa]|uniref:C2 domain-containing protein n=1 Tax=Reticulomyxa filosa TaxID=46433 RepID=X6NDW6_RETFI|nr:hypothetical protein RFI_12643 [Reticulomyxa filosa]|eukprot:ETO24515.1 hypothetical protein RFI_12643 [Reticulomyxa filosa]